MFCLQKENLAEICKTTRLITRFLTFNLDDILQDQLLSNFIFPLFAAEILLDMDLSNVITREW